jgi:cAMP-dependent protein kinase regulator
MSHAPSTKESLQLKKQKTDFSSDSEGDYDDDIEHEDITAKKLDQLKTQKKKMAISAEAYGSYNKIKEHTSFPVVPKSDAQKTEIRAVLQMSFMFNALEDREFDIIINAMNIRVYKPNEWVIKQGDDGAELFVVSSGKLKCEKVFPGKDAPTFLKFYQRGDVFGELALMYNAPRAASIIALEEATLFSLDRDTFNNIVKTATIRRRETYENFLKKVEILSELEDYERAKLCDCLKTEKFDKGDFIIKEGEVGDKFYFIQEGTADALKNEGGKLAKVFEYGPNDYFGELALLDDDNHRRASIQVTSDVMRVAVMNKLTFKRILGPIENILKRNAGKYQKFVKK